MDVAEDENIKKEYWLECIKEWYPDRHTKAYFLPPVIFKRKNYDVKVIADHPALVPQPPLKRYTKEKKPPPDQLPHYPHQQQTAPLPKNKPGSVCALPQGEPAPLPQPSTNWVLNDDAAEHVFRCLQAFSQQKRSDAMMVISELDFRKLPRPASIKDQNSDFDILIIHRRHGLIACEIKAVGTSTPDLEKHVKKVVDQASKQLKKAKEYLTEFLQDMKLQQAVNITTSLVLPNVTSSQVKDAVKDDPQSLYDCVDSADMPGAIKRCLCKDKMPSIEELNALGSLDARQTITILSAFSDWWQEMTAGSSGKDLMPEGVYDELLARFCGDAATVEVFSVAQPRKAVNRKKNSTNRIQYTSGMKPIRTPGQAVAETGLIMSLLTLYPDQVDLVLDNRFNCVHLYGPPGTGKTVVLYLKACQWLEQGHDVHVISLNYEGRAVSHVLERQLKEYLAHRSSASTPKIHRHFLSPFKPISDIMKELEEASKKEELYIIADEVISLPLKHLGRSSESPGADKQKQKLPSNTERFEEFANALYRVVQDGKSSLSLWSASMKSLQNQLPWMQEEKLTTPLRTPPAVTREVEKSVEMAVGDSAIVPPYSCINNTATTTGVTEIPVKWVQHSQHKDAQNVHPMLCDACGEAVVKFLEELEVGKDESSPLQYRDVFILTTWLPEESQKGGITSALRLKGKDFRVVKQPESDPDQDRYPDFVRAILGEKNEIIITSHTLVSGLERPVVIGMGVHLKVLQLRERLMSMSRCSGQLMWIGEVSKA